MKQVESKVLTVEDKKINKEFQKELDFIRHCDSEIDKHLTHKGEALIRIRDEKLYRIRYKNFEEAVSGELGISRQEGYRLIDDVATVKALKLSPKGDKIIQEMDLKTHHIRALAANTDDAEDQVKVLEHIQQRQLPVTAKVIEQVADEILPPKIEPEVERPKSKATSFDPAEFDEAVQFDPESIEGTKEPEPVDAEARFRVDCQAGQIGCDISNAIKSVERLMNAIDAVHAKSALTNHRVITASYQRLHKELSDAAGTMVQMERAWKASAK